MPEQWKRYFTIRNQGKDKDSGEILIYGLVGESLFSDGVGSKQFAKELKGLGDVKNIDIRINSPGGSLYEGLAIYNLLTAHKAEKTIYVDGFAGSIASVIAMCGHVVMPENASMWIHDPVGGIHGYAKDMRKYADDLDKVKLGIISAYENKCKLKPEDISAMMTEETFMTAGECMEKGFCDEIVEPVRMAANYDAVKCRNILADFSKTENRGQEPPKKEGAQMNKCTVCGLEYVNSKPACECEKNAMKNQIDTAVEMENKRIAEILAVAADHGFMGLAQEYIKSKKPAPDFKSAVLAKIANGEKGVPINGWFGIGGKENTKPFKSLGEQLITIANSTVKGRVDDRLASIQNAVLGGSGGVPSDGGFLIQEDFTTALLAKTMETGQVSRRCFNIPLSGNSNRLKAPVINETSRVTGSRWGGVQVYRVDEGGAGTPKKPKLAMLEMNAEKMMGIAYATDEMLADAAMMGAIYDKAFVGEFSWMLDDEIINGDGAGKCLGIMNSPALVTIAKETGQLAKTIEAENIENMYARLPASLVGGAVWFINQDCWPQIFQLKRVIGTAGFPLYMGPTGIAGAPYGTLLGLPIVPIEQCKTIGTTGDILLCNMGEYALITKGGVTSERSIHVEFLTDQMAFRWIVRNNGQPAWKNAVTPANGTNTVSPFLAVATRA